MDPSDTIRTNASGLAVSKTLKRATDAPQPIALAPQHTPGPWFRSPYGYLVASVPAEPVAGCKATHSRQVCNVQQTENPADIPLLAAAPDMLDALRYGAEWFAKFSPSCNTADGGTLPHPMLECFRAAIAKAEGRS